MSATLARTRSCPGLKNRSSSRWRLYRVGRFEVNTMRVIRSSALALSSNLMERRRGESVPYGYGSMARELSLGLRRVSTIRARQSACHDVDCGRHPPSSSVSSNPARQFEGFRHQRRRDHSCHPASFRGTPSVQPLFLSESSSCSPRRSANAHAHCRRSTACRS